MVKISVFKIDNKGSNPFNPVPVLKIKEFKQIQKIVIFKKIYLVFIIKFKQTIRKKVKKIAIKQVQKKK